MHRFAAQFGTPNTPRRPQKRPTKWAFRTVPSEANSLEFLEKITRRAGDIYSAWNATLPVFDPFHDTSWFGTLRTVRALVGVHDLFTVAGLGNLCHSACSP